MKTVLLITDVNFWEKSSGNRTRISSLIDFLSKQVQLTVVNTGPAPESIEKHLGNLYSAEFLVLEKHKYLNSNGYGRKLRSFIKKRHFDVIIIEYIHSSYFLNFLIEDTIVILDAHDIISRRTDEFKKFNYGGALYEMQEATETALFKVYDKVMVLCPEDVKEVDRMAGPGKALLCPHPVKAHAHAIRKTVKNLVFVASAYLPNIDAISWFVENCWPEISAQHDARLFIYGTVCNGLKLSDNKNIILKGYVDDIELVYGQADILINPVRFGAGIKIKNVEALACGLPLVTTTHGARGLEDGIHKAFLVADDPRGFIDGIQMLFNNDLRREIFGKNAMTFVTSRFSPEACYKELMRYINYK